MIQKQGRHRGKGRPNSDPAALKRDERVLRALEMRKAGWPWAFIAQDLGWKSPSAAYQAVKALLEAVEYESVHEYRELENQRLDDMLRVAWPMMLQGDLAAMDRCVKIGIERRKLLGADAPPQAPVDQHGNTVGAADAVAEFYARVASALARTGAGGGDGNRDAGTGAGAAV